MPKEKDSLSGQNYDLRDSRQPLILVAHFSSRLKKAVPVIGLLLLANLLWTPLEAWPKQNQLKPMKRLSQIEQKNTKSTFSFSISGQSEADFDLSLEASGRVMAFASWTGAATSLALILNGPGQVQYYARRDGPSPLKLEFEITSELLNKGKDWKLSLVSFQSGDAQGNILFQLPAGSSIKQRSGQVSTAATNSGAGVKAAATPSGSGTSVQKSTSEKAEAVSTNLKDIRRSPVRAGDTRPSPPINPYSMEKGRHYSLKSFFLNNTLYAQEPVFIWYSDMDLVAGMRPIIDASDSKRATFKIVDGLANNYYFSFESRHLPGYYLRDEGDVVKIDRKPDGQSQEYAKAATFNIVKALTGDHFPCISIESQNRPGNYLYARPLYSQYNRLLGIGNGDSEEFKKSATFRLEFQVTNPPTEFVLEKKDPKDAEWDDVSSEEIQGIAHSETHWYISNKDTIHKTKKNQIKSVVKKVKISSIQNRLGAGGNDYDHFGDIDFYDGLLYVATTGKNNATPIVIVFDENLNFKKYAYFPSNKQSEAGWVAINPVTGYLYSSDPYRRLHVYDRDFNNGSTLTSLYDISLSFKYGAPNENEWKKVANQGGAFSPNGIFYYVLDHKEDEYCNYTGIHAFLIHGQWADEITITGMNNHKERVNFMNEKYDPDQLKWRNWEFEGITIWDRRADGLGQIHVLQLHNEDNDEDDAHLFHYRVNNEY